MTGPRRLVPGVALCAGIALAATALGWIEAQAFGHAWIEPLVLAVLIGAAVRTAWTPPERYRPGIGLTAREALETAVALLGAQLSVQAIVAAGPALLAGIAVVVAVALVAGYAIGRALGLRGKPALLIAVGNAICGNSAIAAVAPVIRANGQDVASAIAFTAVLGVVVVLLLPLLAGAMTEAQFGMLAGLTVYAVPQVLAATLPVGAVAAQIGTLVKLVRVLMLGPVVLGLSVLMARRGAAGARPPLSRMVPWFILAFVALAVCRAAGLVPDAALPVLAWATTVLTVLAMAALGLGVDIRAVARAGALATAAVTLSLLVLFGMALGLVRALG